MGLSINNIIDELHSSTAYFKGFIKAYIGIEVKLFSNIFP